MEFKKTYLSQVTGVNTLIVSGRKTLYDAVTQIGEKQLHPRNTQLIISLPNHHYRTILAEDLSDFVQEDGLEVFNDRLENLPIPQASTVKVDELPDNLEEVQQWILDRPETAVVIVERRRNAIGVLTVSTAESSSGEGGIGPSDLTRLFGEYQKSDYRRLSPGGGPPRKCPHCGHVGHRIWDFDKGKMVCQNCGQ